MTELYLGRTLTQLFTGIDGSLAGGGKDKGLRGRLSALGELAVAYTLMRGLPKVTNYLAEHSRNMKPPFFAAGPRVKTAPVSVKNTSKLPTRSTRTNTTRVAGGKNKGNKPASDLTKKTTGRQRTNSHPRDSEGRPQTLGEVMKGLPRINPGGPTVPGRHNNCQKCVENTDTFLAGNGARPTTPGKPNGGPYRAQAEHAATKNCPAEIPKLAEWHSTNKLKDIEGVFKALGPMARGRVHGIRNGKPGHVFNVWSDKTGRLFFLDGQTGKPATFRGQGYESFEFIVTDGRGRLPAVTPVKNTKLPPNLNRKRSRKQKWSVNPSLRLQSRPLKKPVKKPAKTAKKVPGPVEKPQIQTSKQIFNGMTLGLPKTNNPEG